MTPDHNRAGNSASICRIPPGYNRNLSELRTGFRVVDNARAANLNCQSVKVILATVIIMAVLGAAGAQVRRPAPKVGDKAPDFSLPNADGKPVSLSDYTSRGPVVVIFYRGYW